MEYLKMLLEAALTHYSQSPSTTLSPLLYLATVYSEEI